MIIKGARLSYALDKAIPLKWIEEDEQGYHYMYAAVQLGQSIITHGLRMDCIATEYRRTSTHVDLRLYPVIDVYQSAPGTHQPAGLSLSHAGAIRL